MCDCTVDPTHIYRSSESTKFSVCEEIFTDTLSNQNPPTQEAVVPDPSPSKIPGKEPAQQQLFHGHLFINCHVKLVLLVNFFIHRILRQLRKVTRLLSLSCWLGPSGSGRLATFVFSNPTSPLVSEADLPAMKPALTASPPLWEPGFPISNLPGS